jgi:hypothetical protein
MMIYELLGLVNPKPLTINLKAASTAPKPAPVRAQIEARSSAKSPRPAGRPTLVASSASCSSVYFLARASERTHEGDDAGLPGLVLPTWPLAPRAA